MKSIDDKVKSWQRQESERQLGATDSQDAHDSSDKDQTSNGVTAGRNERLTVLDVKVKSLQGGTMPTSQHTASTNSCSETGTGGNESLPTTGKHLCTESDAPPEETTTSIREDAGPWRPPVLCRSMGVGEWEPPVDMTGEVNEVFRAPAAIAAIAAERYLCTHA
jgi:hypothetical protein